ncbi:recombination protein RecT [Lysinibacillus mangiferihumi]|uniref:Recombination protein RecT n=1 Tax=Lysinibacillus mangiferihumi TaxID=1130819 RepID=A0A4U2YX04_9BACI|nr:RecT family recombinase [Lysinibacillus mangiferihumi]TKI65595.1 recombination protein RecT [Lysinibacillus mangiferihumi]
MTNQVAQQQQQVATKEKQNAFVTQVAKKIEEMKQQGQINLPDNYSAVNALQAAYFTLTAVDFGSSKALIDKVTPESVAFALQDMAIQGLSVAKKQGYFVPYGDKLQFLRSYHGTQAVLKRLNGVKDIWANVIWKGEEFEVEYNERGQLAFKAHKVNWKAATGKKEDIEGAYCIIEREDGYQFLTVMTMDEIATAWSTAKTQNVQNKYPQEMAKRTVINRASKAFINTSDDSDLLIESVNRTTENEFEPTVKDMGDIEEVKREIEQNANSEVIDISNEPAEKVEATVVVATKKPVEQQQASFTDGPGF